MLVMEQCEKYGKDNFRFLDTKTLHGRKFILMKNEREYDKVRRVPWSTVGHDQCVYLLEPRKGLAKSILKILHGSTNQS